MPFLPPLWKIFPCINYERYTLHLVIKEDHTRLDKLYRRFGRKYQDREKKIMIFSTTILSNNPLILKWGYQQSLSFYQDEEPYSYIANIILSYMLRIYTLFGEEQLLNIGYENEIRKIFMHIVNNNFWNPWLKISHKLFDLYRPIDDYLTNEMKERIRNLRKSREHISYINYTKVRSLILISRVVGCKSELSANLEMTHKIFKLLG